MADKWVENNFVHTHTQRKKYCIKVQHKNKIVAFAVFYIIPIFYNFEMIYIKVLLIFFLTYVLIPFAYSISILKFTI